ncbi:MAG: VanZ family protein [Candidatus Diapherotrites archaeon]
MLRNFDKKRIFYLFMTLLIAIVIFYASTIEATAGKSLGVNLATIYHFGIFFMLTFFLSLTITNKKISNKTILITLLISLTYALSDEFHQLFVPGRFASLKDILIDGIGSLCAVLSIKQINKFNKL